MSKMVYTILLLIGLVLFAFAMFKLWKTFSFMKSGYATQATVIGFRESRGSKGGTTYAPVYQYTTDGQNTVTYQENVYSRPATRSLNEQVKILYDPQHPEEVMIVSYWGLFRWTIILLAIAMPFLIIGGGYFMALRYLS